MTVWRGKQPLILASQSRTRQALLVNAGIAFKAHFVNLDSTGAGPMQGVQTILGVKAD